jgi:hypothetical protein
MSFVVRTKDDLQTLLRSDNFLKSIRKPQLLIRIPNMAVSESKSWEWRLESLRQECGCSSGALGVFGFAFFVVSYLLYTNSPAVRDLRTGVLALYGGVFVAGLALSAVIGKFIGLRISAIRFRQTCFKLHERLRMLENEDEPHRRS